MNMYNTLKTLGNLHVFFPHKNKEVAFIYFIMSIEDKFNHKKNKIKIGVSTDPKKRILGLQTGNPCELKMVYFFPVDSEDSFHLEENLHIKFKNMLHRGEWFIPKRKLWKWVKAHKKLAKKYSAKKIIKRVGGEYIVIKKAVDCYF